MLLTRRPHECAAPAPIVRNDPVGIAVRWPRALEPQHINAVLLRMPQECWSPRSRATPANRPEGGVDSPWKLLPQQARLPSPLTPQLCDTPDAKATNARAGGVTTAGSLL